MPRLPSAQSTSSRCVWLWGRVSHHHNTGNWGQECLNSLKYFSTWPTFPFSNANAILISIKFSQKQRQEIDETQISLEALNNAGFVSTFLKKNPTNWVVQGFILVFLTPLFQETCVLVLELRETRFSDKWQLRPQTNCQSTSSPVPLKHKKLLREPFSAWCVLSIWVQFSKPKPKPLSLSETSDWSPKAAYSRAGTLSDQNNGPTHVAFISFHVPAFFNTQGRAYDPI